MGLFESPSWDVDKSAEVLSEKFGKVSRSRRKRGKKRTQDFKPSTSKAATLKKNSNEKCFKENETFVQTSNSLSEGRQQSPVNAFERPSVKAKKKNVKSAPQLPLIRAQHQNEINKRRKTLGEKNKEDCKLKRKAKKIESSKHSGNGGYQNACLNSKNKRRHSPDPVKSHSFIFKSSEGEKGDIKELTSSAGSLNNKTKNKNFQEFFKVKKKKSNQNADFKQKQKLKVEKNDLVDNSPAEQIQPVTDGGNNKKFQGSIEKVIASNVYASHSVKEHKEFKNKKQKVMKQENLDHSVRESEVKTPKSFASRLLKYAARKNIPVSSQSNEHSKKGKKRKFEEDLQSPEPENKIKKSKTLETGSLRERMMNQLKSSRFRYINEQLYTTTGSKAHMMFKTDPDSFYAYHEGYKQQVAQWPMNPLDKIMKSIKKKPAKLVVADFGCGDAQLAKSLPNKVYSFDLVALSSEVTVCDMAHTPLSDSSIDIAVFCLSLMGTDLVSYIREANRVLKVGGLLKVAEVASRFENVERFSKSLKKYGFNLQHKDYSDNLFYFMDFKKDKTLQDTKKLPSLSLKPCLYKKR